MYYNTDISHTFVHLRVHWSNCVPASQRKKRLSVPQVERHIGFS